MSKTSRRSLLQMLPAVLTFGLFESRVLAEAGVKSPISLDREVLPEHMYAVTVRAIDDDGYVLDHYYTVQTVATEKDTRPYVLAALQDLLIVIADFDFLFDGGLHWSKEAAAKALPVCDWLWRVWKVRDAKKAAEMIAEAGSDTPEGLILDFPIDLTPTELDDFISLIDLTELIRIDRVSTQTQEAWRELEAKTKEGVTFTNRYNRLKKAPGTFLKLCQADIIRECRETHPDTTDEEIAYDYPEYFPKPAAG